MGKFALAAIMLFMLPSHSFASGDVYSAMKHKMSYLNQRQSLLSANISNADTPGYKASDLTPMGSKNPSVVKLATTSPMHIASAGGNSSFRRVKDKTAETSLDGNNVDLQEQMVKMSETDMEYRATLGFMRQMNSLMRVAIGGNQQ